MSVPNWVPLTKIRHLESNKLFLYKGQFNVEDETFLVAHIDAPDDEFWVSNPKCYTEVKRDIVKGKRIDYSFLRDANPQKTKRSASPKVKAKERWLTVNEFIDFSMRDLTPVQIKVWMILFRDTKKNGWAKTTMRDMAVRAGAGLKFINKAVKDLEAKGLLKVKRDDRYHVSKKTGEPCRNMNRYRVFGLGKE